MKTLLPFLLMLLGLRAAVAADSAAPPSRRHSATYEQERAAPRPNPAIEQLARRRAAYLTSVLHLCSAQTHQLQHPIYEQLQELQWLHELATPDADPSADAREEAARQQYHRQLMHILSPGQYAALLRLEGSAGQRLASATRP